MRKDLMMTKRTKTNQRKIFRVKDKLREYGKKCKLDIYLNLCEQDYVGADYVDNALNSQEICRTIGQLKQEWRTTNGRVQIDTPDKINTCSL